MQRHSNCLRYSVHRCQCQSMSCQKSRGFKGQRRLNISGEGSKEMVAVGNSMKDKVIKTEKVSQIITLICFTRKITD